MNILLYITGLILLLKNTGYWQKLMEKDMLMEIQIIKEKDKNN